MRFTATSVALFAGAALAIPAYEYDQTIYSTREVTITSCGPEVTDCPGKHPSQTGLPTPPVSAPVSTGTGVSPGKPSETSYSTEYITVTDCGPEVSDCPSHSTRTHISIGTVIPTGLPSGVPSPSSSGNPIKSENPPYPTGGNPGPSTSVVTYTTCIPTEMTSIVTLWPTPAPSGTQPGQPGQPGSTWVPSGTVPGAPSGTGVPPQPSSTGPPIFEGAANTFSGSFFAVGVAAVVAVLFA
ncbi:hypothetical protein LOZ53_006723 [Ophidiomyces ophidiicola]|uniref:Uncharacterized protein n=1 Tax=Ophidiomyces ophidiicola TaxID=1387563 RepID=A0ACB8UN52_9EURO|nr:hypothetical protein LOZ61_003437 [Ophidiomyces ophidiicola]KAI1920500.1 hypothetical protein LOZ64_001816 [Ophidiomyces ophidiicola]KAI1928087.1 hypothetical protein LOZ60_002580 [Ophidiomyces ophidiicola]KAI1932550.1 hypothetical protein LOZ62_006614 [Ophidiomyces ophidiicola]KAI1952107.1 hypothetical protein LOZ59_005504 [Ophidiomyces ophidiicola]